MLNISQITPTFYDKLNDLRLPSEFSSDLAYISGVLAGDGHIRIKDNPPDYSITCVGNPKDEREFYDIVLSNLFLRLFNIKLRTKLIKNGTTYGFTFGSKSLALFLTNVIGLPSGRKDGIEIPKIILENKEFTKFFIQGMADTDGCLSLKRRYKTYPYYPVITIVSKSKKILDQIGDFLLLNEFKISKNRRKYFDNRINKTIITYDISIYGHFQLVKWMNFIGFRHPKHLKKFELWKKINKNNKRANLAFNEIKNNSGEWI